jgi:hypothetical protein
MTLTIQQVTENLYKIIIRLSNRENGIASFLRRANMKSHGIITNLLRAFGSGSHYFSDILEYFSEKRLESMCLDENRLKVYSINMGEIRRMLAKNRKRAVHALGEADCKFLFDEIEKMQNELYQLFSNYSRMRILTSKILKKVKYLAIKLGISTKPFFNNLLLTWQAGHTLASYQEGNIFLNIRALVEHHSFTELSLAHEFAHSMQPLIKYHASVARKENNSMLNEISNSLNFVSQIFNKIVKDYNYYSLVNKIKLEEAYGLVILGDFFMNFIVHGGSIERIHNDFLNATRDLSKKLILLERVLLFRSKRVTDKREIEALEKVLKAVRSSRKLLGKAYQTFDKAFADLSKVASEIQYGSVGKHIIEGFATVFEYLYGKEYGLPNLDEYMTTSIYYATATKAYLIYVKHPQILKGIFTGYGGSIKSMKHVADEFNAVNKELAAIEF